MQREIRDSYFQGNFSFNMLIFTAASNAEQKKKSVEWNKMQQFSLFTMWNYSFDVFLLHGTLKNIMFIFFSSTFLDFLFVYFSPAISPPALKWQYSQTNPWNHIF